jgi:thiamine biosynthesis lipoprotein
LFIRNKEKNAREGRKRMESLKNYVVEFEGFAMNTEITFKLYGAKAKKTIRRLSSEITCLERKMSRFISGSDVGKINASSGKNPVRISRDTFEVLTVSKEFYEITRGAFNILVGPVADVWDYQNSVSTPEDSKISRALDLADCHDLILDSEEQTARLKKPGQSIDLGAIGKGYAGDRCMAILKENQIESGVINLGGNVCVRGKKPDGSPWRVGVRHPREENALIGFVEVADKHVVTSGDYERYFNDEKGIRRHHILNPATGYPTESGLVSVTVVSENGTVADALATSLFAMGRENCPNLLSHFPGSEVLLVDESLEVYVTRGLTEIFKGFDEIKLNII